MRKISRPLLCCFVPMVLVAAALAQTRAAPNTARPLLPDDVVQRIREEGLERSRVMYFLDRLCNDIGPRLTGSDNFRIACEWARSEFAAMGLDARLEKWGRWNLIWNRGQWSGRVVEPEAFELFVATPAWTAGTKGRVRARLLSMPKTEAGLAALAKREGTFYLYGRPPSSRSTRGRRLAELEKQGKIAGYVQNSASGMIDRRYPNQIRVFGSSIVARGSFEKRPRTPRIVVRADQAERLEQLLKGKAPVVVEFDVRNRFREGPIELYNVVADLKGTDKPDEVIVVCGHLDSWHQATGATDNGTGASSTMEAARILTAAGVRPKRTIRFILWGGEEQGLLGSLAYVNRHRKEMAKVSAVFNHDTGTNWAHSLTVTEAMYPIFQRALAPVMELPAPEEDYDGPVFRLRKTKTMGVGGGSDHVSFQRAGVPAWSWGLRGRSSYGYGWHSQWDTYDIAIPEYQRHTATVIALTVAGLAEYPGLLPREGVTRTRARGGFGDAAAYVGRILGAELKGMRVESVEKGGIAAGLGLRKGDVLVEVAGREVKQAVDVLRALRAARDQAKIEVVVRRDGKSVKLATDNPRRSRRR